MRPHRFPPFGLQMSNRGTTWNIIQHISLNDIYLLSYHFISTKHILGICVEQLGVFVPLFILLLTKRLVLVVNAA